MVRNKEEKVNWTFDFKKIRILNYLLANRDGALRVHLLSLKRERQFGTISSSEIDTILRELEWDGLITHEELRPTGNIVYRISEKGIKFITTLKTFENTYSADKFFILDALREPTDQVRSRNNVLTDSQDR